uniref:Endonuclease/exonuclease/phosphatase domain-containing protein n=1 Tax=Setaria viridis TaxID=4556 RepID=A0A4V6Y8I6_SETVI|nr:hypothetical protein SEVIR_4G160800v2 [Setaria viridis]
MFIFCHLVKECGFMDLWYNDPTYTWSNKQFYANPTFERLDRCLENAEWCAAFPSIAVFHLPMMKSDHSSILAILETSQTRKKPFRFENCQVPGNRFAKMEEKETKPEFSVTSS